MFEREAAHMRKSYFNAGRESETERAITTQGERERKRERER